MSETERDGQRVFVCVSERERRREGWRERDGERGGERETERGGDRETDSEMERVDGERDGASGRRARWRE